EQKRLGKPIIVALNMSDLAAQPGYTPDRAALGRWLGVPVVPTDAVRSGGQRALVDAIDTHGFATETAARVQRLEPPPVASAADIEATQREVRRVLHEAGYRVPARLAVLSRLDALVLHPIPGPAPLAVVP